MAGQWDQIQESKLKWMQHYEKELEEKKVVQETKEAVQEAVLK